MSKDDVSLDDELLLVTEKKSNKAVVQKKSKDNSPKRDEDEGEASGSGGEDNSDHKQNNKRKPKSEPKKPLKKRKTGESSDESSDDEVYDDGWDEDLMGDEDDRAKLMGMAMIEREAILDERYTKRKELREAWAVKRRLKQEQRDRDRRDKRDRSDRDRDRSDRDRDRDRSDRDRSDRDRDRSDRDRERDSLKDTAKESSKDREIRDRGAKKSDSKGKALSELKKKRAKAGYKKSDSEEEEEGEVEETKDDEDDEYEPKKKSASSDNHTSKSSKSKDDDDRPKEKIVYHSDDEDRPITLEEVEKIRLNRLTLEQWVDKPFFSSLIPGFFVRIGIGMDPQSRMNVYRLAEISSVEVKANYVLNGKQTNKWLRLLIGDKAKEFRMETISNRPVTESEYKHWRMQMKIASRSVPTSLDVPKKVETLAIAKDYRYTSEDIQKMLQEKKDAGALPIKLGAEKARLAILRDTSTNAHEKAELEKRIAELDELVKEREKKRVNTASVSNINQRNKQYNFITTLESKAEEKTGNSDTDPFSRRRTLPRITYASKHKMDEDEPQATTPPPSSSPIPATNGTNGTSADTPSSSSSSSSSSSTPSSSSNGNPLQGSTGVPEPIKTSEHDTIDIDIPLTSTPTSRPFPSHSLPPSSLSSSQPEKKKPTLSLDDYMRRRKAME